jgi:hypothetical protein
MTVVIPTENIAFWPKFSMLRDVWVFTEAFSTSERQASYHKLSKMGNEPATQLLLLFRICDMVSSE